MATSVSKAIDELLKDLGEPLDGTGLLNRVQVRDIINLIQKQISIETENILSLTEITTIATDTITLTVDSDGNLLRIYTASRVEPSQSAIKVWTKEQIEDYDYQWKTREGNLIQVLITDIADPGEVRNYPKVDNGDNEVDVYFIKLASDITAEFTEAGDAGNQLSAWIINGLTSANSDTLKLYFKLTDGGASAYTVNLYKDSAGGAGDLVATGTRTGNGSITLSASNDSGISGSVTVAFSGDDTTVSANILTFTALEIPTVDKMCLLFGCKWMILNLETDKKNEAKAKDYLKWYGYDESGNHQHTGALDSVKERLKKIRGSTYTFAKERDSGENTPFAFIDNTPIT